MYSPGGNQVLGFRGIVHASDFLEFPSHCDP